MPCPRPSHAASAALAALAAAAAAACGAAEDTDARPSLLLIVVDTLRADHVTAYGYERATTPALDALATTGLVFTRAQTPQAKTTPAVASILSGLYPHGHGVRDLGHPLDRDVPLLAEALAAEGYDTAAVVGNYVLRDELSGLARGFATWVEDMPDAVGVPPDDVPQRRADSLTDAALALFGLEGGAEAVVGDGPWLVYLHYMDPHGTYDPPAEHRVFEREQPRLVPEPEALAPHPFLEQRIADYNVPAEARLPDGRIDAARVVDLYDGEIRFADAEIGRLLARLRAAGLLDDALVVVTSDHGESLGEHRYWFEHGYYAYEATCRVPLIVAGPGVARGRVEADVSLADLAPTLLERCGARPLPLPEGVDPTTPRGRSLGELLAGRPDPAPSAVFCEKTKRRDLEGTVQIKAARLGRWKLIRRFTQVARGFGREPIVLGEELYDVEADPSEANDLFAAPPPGAPLARLRAELLRFARDDVRFADLAETLRAEREELERTSPDVVRILEKLGY